jgi:hypothetical protein
MILLIFWLVGSSPPRLEPASPYPDTFSGLVWVMISFFHFWFVSCGWFDVFWINSEGGRWATPGLG